MPGTGTFTSTLSTCLTTQPYRADVCPAGERTLTIIDVLHAKLMPADNRGQQRSGSQADQYYKMSQPHNYNVK